MIKFRILLISIIMPFLVFSQTKETKTAFDIFNNYEYNKSINLLEKAYTKETDDNYKLEIVFKLGESYKFMSRYADALVQYERASRMEYGPKADYNYGKMLQMLGRYDEAERVLKDYLEESPSDERVNRILESINLAKQYESDKTDYKSRNLEELNTIYNDFAPSFFGKKESENVLVFTSTRLSKISTKEDEWLGTGFSNFYLSFLERKGNDILSVNSKWSQGVSFSNIINTNLHEGASTFTLSRNEVYFTRCDYSTEEESGCGIYYSKLEDGVWSNPVVVIESVNGSVAGHPAISNDGNKLVFSSDGFNTIGQKDLFYITKDRNGSWVSDKPKSLGRNINTKGNEMYPWIAENGDLYFSSDGHKGLGGLDIFVAKQTTRSWGKPVNLKSPINSPADDFGVVFNKQRSVGYISSNRQGGAGMDDIYEIRLLPLLYSLNGKVIDTNTGNKLSGVKIKLEGNDGTVNFVETNKDGDFVFNELVLKADVSYKLVLKLNKYLAQVASFTTLGIPLEQFAPVDGGYLAKSKLDVEMDHISDPIVLPHIEYDYNKSDLRDISKESLNNLIDILEENPSIVIKLRSHTDHKGGDKYNIDLSQRRAQSCVDYLISKGVEENRLVAEGMGEGNPFVIPENFESSFDNSTILTEDYIAKLDKVKEEEARQYNRRTDFKVLGQIVERQMPIDSTVAVGEDFSDHKMLDIDTIPDTSSRVEEVAAAKVNEETVKFYKMQSGDNFGDISKKFNITVKEIKALNGGLRATRPFDGMMVKVNLNADYTEFDTTHYRLQRADNTFEKLLEKTKLSEDDFFDLNPEFIEDNLRAGELVVVE